MISKHDMVIAADGGYLYTQRAGIRADVIIGDFDSLGGIPGHEAGEPHIIRLPKEKDQTDTLAALQYGLERGFSHFCIYGGAGGRLDHTIANVQCLVFLLKHGARGYLFNDYTVATAIETELKLAPRDDGIISVFAIGGPAGGVSLRGLKYELDDVTLTPDFPLGISNEFIGQSSCISVKQGSLLVIYPAGTHEL